MSQQRQNLFCNFRAPNQEWHQVWLDLKEETKSQGLDICYVVLSLCRTWLKAQKEVQATCQIKTNSQVITIYQTNTFNYNVQKPRRERFQIDCSKNKPKCTLCSRAFQAYITEKARELDMSFSFKDFPEINHDLFRKLILELKKRRKILALKPRTNQRLYILTEWRSRYSTMNENNTVKPRFTGESEEQDDEQKGDF